jgi:hypothetical protein
MKHQCLFFALGVTALVAVTQAQVVPNTALTSSKAVKNAGNPTRLPDGHPDLQGFWSNNNATPLERPKELNGRATLTDEELAKMKAKAHELFGGTGDAAFGDQIYNTVLANVLGVKS